MQYDGSAIGMTPWYWPSDNNGQRIPPDELDDYTRSHYFMPPNCLCAYVEGTKYSRCHIGLVEVAVARQECELREFVGEYVATCRQGSCGYFVVLERFYSAKLLLVKNYPARESPLQPDMWKFTRDDCDATVQKGFLQILPDVSCQTYLRTAPSSHRLLQAHSHDLSSPAPDGMAVAASKNDFNSLVTSSLPEDKFWDLFLHDLEGTAMPEFEAKAYGHGRARTSTTQQ
ncbi:hypothetical protein BKA70DRAFT_1443451 [Coprinopsis sp. MPI-PUGE-AT-0042]|nr:hypothetical protein BKA70DRAFT_1443451 [Coprinopsis sp. MPI-PUGE-AT-0042]